MSTFGAVFIFAVLALWIGMGVSLLRPAACAMARAVWRRLRLQRPCFMPLRSMRGEEIYGWDDWRSDAIEEHPIRYFLTEYLPRLLERRPRDLN